MGVRENKVERYLDREVRKLGGITRKWVSPGHDGVPDRILICKAFRAPVVFVEVKTADGTKSPVQRREHIRLIENGAEVHTVYGEVGVDRLLGDLQL